MPSVGAWPCVEPQDVCDVMQVQEGKVKEALHNYYRSRQNAKTIEYSPFTLKKLVKMLPNMRQHRITWIGRRRVGKSLGSKTIFFMQSRFEIAQAARTDQSLSPVSLQVTTFCKFEGCS